MTLRSAATGGPGAGARGGHGVMMKDVAGPKEPEWRPLGAGGARVAMRDHAPLDWLNPFWREELTVSVPHPPAGCRRRLEHLAGHPGPFVPGYTAGTVSDEGFRLVWRFRSRGIHYATVLARGRIDAADDGARVEMRTTYAPQMLVWTLVIYIVLGVGAAFEPAASPWRIGLPLIAVVSWPLGIWLSHRLAGALQGTILAALAAEPPDAHPRAIE